MVRFAGVLRWEGKREERREGERGGGEEKREGREVGRKRREEYTSI